MDVDNMFKHGNGRIAKVPTSPQAMKASIETREIITLAEGGINLRGTYHRAQDERSDSAPVAKESNRIGVLFLNFGFHPRSASGDAAVYWADSFAKCGYPSFRLDLPGLGDSDGDLPVEVADFIHLVNAGRYAPLLSKTIKNLTERFNLAGVAIVGQCSGAVSAIYAAAASSDVKGLVLLDPYFHGEEPEGTAIRKEFRRWVLRNRLAGYLSAVYDRLKYFRLLVKANELPRNANLLLIGCWNQLASAGLPILILKAPALNPRVGDFDYLRYIQRISHLTQRIEVKDIEGTNHAFVKGSGKDAVGRYTEQWLRACFPLARFEASDKSRTDAPQTCETASR
jgi:pimeloyl-ACP methyl ester carboxylesterase